jgi:hypothetical protein
MRGVSSGVSDDSLGVSLMQVKPIVRRELATRHRYGPDIARGPYVYVAYDADPDTGGKLVAVAATAGEARKLYSKAWTARHMAGKRG